MSSNTGFLEIISEIASSNEGVTHYMLIIFSNIADQMYRNDEDPYHSKIYSHIYNEARQIIFLNYNLILIVCSSSRV